MRHAQIPNNNDDDAKTYESEGPVVVYRDSEQYRLYIV